MGCLCDKFIDCKDPKIEVGVVDESAGYSHTYTKQVAATNLPFQYTYKVNRVFNVTYGWDRSINITHIVKGDCGQGFSETSCGNAATANASSSQSELCEIELNIPYYIDRKHNIYIWKNIKEKLQWNVLSTDTAAFKLKFGTGYFHKICVPNTVKTIGSEEFFLFKDGTTELLAKQEYEYNPFPSGEGSSTWGLYGNTITQAAEPETNDVAMILLFPLVPKQAIPLDSDVIFYGFYDYNSIAAGFVESSLPEDDGGKDYFYPYWLRQMPADPIWRNAADVRYSTTKNTGSISIVGTTDWVQPEPIVNQFPFGSLCVDSEDNFIASILLEFSQRAGGTGLIYNRSSISNLFNELKNIGLPISSYVKLDPVGLI